MPSEAPSRNVSMRGSGGGPDSAFTIADRMAMLDKGRMLKVETREWFDALRKTPIEEAKKVSEDQQLIRQFLRGDAEGPITKRRELTRYEDDILGHIDMEASAPSIEATRSV